jgi:hypothetical protein
MALSSQKLGYIEKRPVHTYLSVKCQLWPRFRVRNSTFRIGIFDMDVKNVIGGILIFIVRDRISVTTLLNVSHNDKKA